MAYTLRDALRKGARKGHYRTDPKTGKKAWVRPAVTRQGAATRGGRVLAGLPQRYVLVLEGKEVTPLDRDVLTPRERVAHPMRPGNLCTGDLQDALGLAECVGKRLGQRVRVYDTHLGHYVGKAGTFDDFIKGYRKPHARKTPAGVVVRVRGTTTKVTAQPAEPRGKGRAVPQVKPGSHKPASVPPKPAGKPSLSPAKTQQDWEYADRLNEERRHLGYSDGAKHFLHRLAAAVNMGQSPRFIRNLAASLVKRLDLAAKVLAGTTPPAQRQEVHRYRQSTVTAALGAARDLLREADSGKAVDRDTWQQLLAVCATKVDEADPYRPSGGSTPF